MIPTPHRLRRNRLNSMSLGILSMIAVIVCVLVGTTKLLPVALGALGGAGVGLLLYWCGTRRMRKRVALLRTPFPMRWRVLLEQHVAYYRRLDDEERIRFEQLLRIFLDEKQLTGCGVEVDDLIRVLVGASAVIPIFGFPAFEYGMLDEVLIYPHAFSIPQPSYLPQEDANTLGMVGDRSIFSGTMVLSKPDLLRGFGIDHDKGNVGIHEFAHLVDKADGRIDGVPAGLPYAALKPWLAVVEEELHGKGPHDLPAYAYTNEEEFLAVTSELFFENPQQLQTRHPALYDLLSKAYHQNPTERIGHSVRKLVRASLRGNSPCPCGSGRKFKVCCGSLR